MTIEARARRFAGVTALIAAGLVAIIVLGIAHHRATREQNAAHNRWQQPIIGHVTGFFGTGTDANVAWGTNIEYTNRAGQKTDISRIMEPKSNFDVGSPVKLWEGNTTKDNEDVFVQGSDYLHKDLGKRWRTDPWPITQAVYVWGLIGALLFAAAVLLIVYQIARSLAVWLLTDMEQAEQSRKAKASQPDAEQAAADPPARTHDSFYDQDKPTADTEAQPDPVG